MIFKVFGADNCSGCKVVKRVLEQKAVKGVEHFDVNSLNGMEAAMDHSVRSIPTLVIIDGAGKHTYVGEKNCLQGIESHTVQVEA